MKVYFKSLIVSALITSPAMSEINKWDKANIASASGLHSICQQSVTEIAQAFLELDNSKVVVITQNGQITIPNGQLNKMNGPAFYLTYGGSAWNCDYTVAGADDESLFKIPWRNEAQFSKVMNYVEVLSKLNDRSFSSLNMNDHSWTIIKRKMISQNPESDLYEFIATSDYYLH